MTLKGNWNIASADIPDQFSDLAMAYLSASKYLCSRLIECSDEFTYEAGCVVMYNTYHAVELFLKGAILRKDKNTKLHHIIDKLAETYEQLYPNKHFQFNIPFGLKVLGYEEAEEVEVRENGYKKMPQDQILKYPIDRSKNKWVVANALDPVRFSVVLQELEIDFKRLIPILKKQTTIHKKGISNVQ